MKSIITAIIVLVVAFAAIVHNGGDVVQAAGPDRVSATRTSRRGNASRKTASRDLEVSVAGIVRSVDYTARRARTAMEEALRSAGADSDREFAVVTVETQERGQVAMIYRRSAQQWKKVRRFLQVGHPATIGSRVRVYGFLQSPSDAPVDVPMDVSAINPPRAVTFYERDRKGETSRYYNQVVDGLEADQRLVFQKVALQGFCMRCRAMADREDVQPVVLPNGSAASRGRCRSCGTIVFRTGQRSTELQARLVAA